MMLLRQHKVSSIAILIVFSVLVLLIYSTLQDGRSFHALLAPGTESVVEPKRTKIAVASTFGFHFDVYMAVAWTVQRVLDHNGLRSESYLQVYAETPFHFGFQTVAEGFGLYRGSFREPSQLVPDLLGEVGYDLVVLGTCEIDLRGELNDELLNAWDNLPEERKFTLICIVHDLSDTAWQDTITEWTRRNSIRLLPISEHVADAFRHTFSVLADSKDPHVASAGYEYIPIDVHVPILDVPEVELPERPGRLLSKAVIQGTFTSGRRNYERIFLDLMASLADDPQIWGYKRREEGQLEAAYEAGDDVDDPFHLYLLGSGWLKVPDALQNIVSVHDDLDYREFFSLMSQMDICLPAFADNGYYDNQASSTFVMALECNVPILLTERTKKAYRYADDDRVTVTRPAAIGEIAALRALRSGLAPPVDENSSPIVASHVKDMMQKGWFRRPAGFDQFKRRVWRENERVIERILSDM